MSARPILFSAPMVRAILAGAKTQTRRVVKAAPGQQSRWLTPALLNSSPRAEVMKGGAQLEHPRGGPLTWVRCPCGAPGDTLWVRETWRADDFDPPGTIYAADHPEAIEETRGIIRWRPSIHMPRVRARITLRVTSVRVERLHAITIEDILSEGVRVPVSADGGAVLVRCTGSDPPVQFLDMRRPRTPEDYLRAEWAALWCEVNGRASYDANPWVWVVGFERVQP